MESRPTQFCNCTSSLSCCSLRCHGDFSDIQEFEQLGTIIALLNDCLMGRKLPFFLQHSSIVPLSTKPGDQKETLQGPLAESYAQSSICILHWPHLPCKSTSPDLIFDLDSTPTENKKFQMKDSMGMGEGGDSQQKVSRYHPKGLTVLAGTQCNRFPTRVCQCMNGNLISVKEHVHIWKL